MRLDVKVLNARLHDQPPQHTTTGGVGPDLRACINAPLTVESDTTYLAPTSMAIYLTDPGYAALILPRSGMDHEHGIVLGNLIGPIDSSYRGQLMISTWNRGSTTFVLNPMERPAQLVIVSAVQAKLNTVDDFAKSERGVGGFSSTGRH